MTDEQLKIIREWIIWHIMRNPHVMHSDARCIEVYGDPGEVTEIDLVDVIASLYEILHAIVKGEPYEYMFHWANKCGSDVDDHLFVDMILLYGGKENE